MERNMTQKYKILARHKGWVACATITESISVHGLKAIL